MKDTSWHLAPASIEIKAGWLLYQTATGTAAPATELTAGEEQAMQETFAANFLGLSRDQRRSDQSDATTLIAVMDQGQEYMPCDALATAFAPGQPVGLDIDASTLTDNLASNTRVALVSETNRAFGVLAKPAAIGDTRILVNFESPVTKNGMF